MKIAVVGSREGFTQEFVFEKLFELTFIRDTIITGGAKGVDTYAIKFAIKMNQDYEVIKPINPSNKLDYLFRNVEIITKADKIIAFWDGVSKGTKFVIDYAKARNKNIVVIKNEPDNTETK